MQFSCSVCFGDRDLVTMMTGESPPEKRIESWQKSQIVVSTPQVIENDLLTRRIDLKDVSLVIFDEAHRAVGDYAYVYIADRYHREAKSPLVLGITASPGSQSEKIAEICTNLSIEISRPVRKMIRMSPHLFTSGRSSGCGRSQRASAYPLRHRGAPQPQNR